MPGLLNRPPERPDAMPERTETVEIPGNRGLSYADRAARTSEIYDVFHAAVDAVLDGFAAPPVLVTVHSFTPVWHGAPRPTEIGLLHDAERARLGLGEGLVESTHLRHCTRGPSGDARCGGTARPERTRAVLLARDRAADGSNR